MASAENGGTSKIDNICCFKSVLSNPIIGIILQNTPLRKSILIQIFYPNRFSRTGVKPVFVLSDFFFSSTITVDFSTFPPFYEKSSLCWRGNFEIPNILEIHETVVLFAAIFTT